MNVVLDDKALQLDRFQLCANNIYRRFYQEQRFYILPELPTSFRRRVVFFPRVSEYIHAFSTYAQNDNFHLDDIPSEVKTAILNKLEEVKSTYARKFDINAKLLEKLKNNLLEFSSQVEALLDFDPQNIIIHPQITGSIGSYSIFLDKEKIYLFPRFDATASDISTLLLHAAMHRKYYFMHKGVTPEILHEISLKVATLKAEKVVKHVFTNVHPTHKLLKQNYCARLIAETVDYLDEIGMPLESQLRDIAKVRDLTDEEHAFLGLLIENRRKMINKADIAKTIWTDKRVEKYSEFALSKLIERTRAKLKASGFSEHMIHTQRGAGAVLFD